MLAEIRDMAATLPTRCPTTLRAGPGVLDELRRLPRPADVPPGGQLPMGMRVVEDDGYPIGVWRIFDQWDDELSAGVLPLPGATVRVKLDDGTDKEMRVMTVRRDEAGRITEYTVADSALVDEIESGARWLDRWSPLQPSTPQWRMKG